MRLATGVVLAAAVGLTAGGAEKKSFDGPTVEAFVGRVVHDGKPVHFPPDEKVQVKLVHESAQSFGIPLSPEGTFQIGWMPIGKYSAVLTRQKEGAKGGAKTYNVPGGLTIEDGKTEYQIELGKNWKL